MSIYLYATFAAQEAVGTLDNGCLSCTVTEELNSSFELELEYSAGGTYASDIQVGRFIVCKPNPYDSNQYFHIFRVAKRSDFTISVYAEHVSYAFNKAICRPDSTYAETAGAAYTLTSYMNTECSANPQPVAGYQLSFGTSLTNTATWSVSSHTEIKNVMSMAAQVFGGEWVFQNNSATLVSTRGQNRGVTLTLSTNLVSLTYDSDITDMYTHIMPFWKGTGDEGNTVTVYSNPRFVSIWAQSTATRYKTYVYDCSSAFSAKPDPLELYQKALDFSIANVWALGIAVNGFDVSVVQRGKTVEGAHLVDADHIEIGDTITITVSELGINTSARVTATKYDVLRDMLTSVTIGQKRAGIVDLLSRAQKKDEEETLEDEDEKEDTEDEGEYGIPDKVVKVSANEVYALYDNGNTKVTWTASGTGNERYNFVKTVVKVEQEDDNESGNGGNDNDVGNA